MISHFKEPMDIASSNFSEESTIYGGNKNFVQGINNVRQQYSPLVMGIASTCLSETIGEDVPSLIAEYKQVNENDSSLPVFIYASTHGFQRVTRAECNPSRRGCDHSVPARIFSNITKNIYSYVCFHIFRRIG